MSNKDTRIITAWIFLIIIFGAVIIGGWVLGVFLVALMILGMKELLALLHTKDLYPSIGVSYAGSFLFMLLGCMSKIQYLHIAAIILVITSFLAILIRGKEAKIKDVGATLITIIYGGLLPSHLLFIRNMDAGHFNIYGLNVESALGYLLLTVCCITVTDVGAYFVGCKFGRHKLWEAVSPKKTIEGSLAGTICSVAVALLIGFDIQIPVWQSICAGIIITIFAQLGDLVESMMKRDAGAKDASDILPGHGGFLDRADSYIFTVAIAYYYFYYVVAHPVF